MTPDLQFHLCIHALWLLASFAAYYCGKRMERRAVHREMRESEQRRLDGDYR